MSAKPVDMLLFCPNCGMQHIDKAEASMTAFDAACYGGDWPGVWKNPPHRSHLCRPQDGGCGHVWRPADVPTNGVVSITSKGADDSPAVLPVRVVRP